MRPPPVCRPAVGASGPQGQVSLAHPSWRNSPGGRHVVQFPPCGGQNPLQTT
ncbi:hypothetical protein A2U01_0087664 [Trifolium medium]|uniref:Uncharacterized protein n=1 Tax=Trifolium medium TaxID=97028 RepID=A0A392U1Y5_9FABA|nr:hypothetical protein [Trifolium medium]